MDGMDNCSVPAQHWLWGAPALPAGTAVLMESKSLAEAGGELAAH